MLPLLVIFGDVLAIYGSYLVEKIDSTLINLNTVGYKLNENLETLKHNFYLEVILEDKQKKKQKS
jgi:hypothetical protein